jgi:Lrp/AsnC family transcriptional regulator for asnA, asnC and gidA
MTEQNPKKIIDAHDEAILVHLREDGRMNVRTLAEKVGLNEATVRARIRRLESSGMMRVVARIDQGAAGFPLTCLAGIRIKGRSIKDVTDDLGMIDEIISIVSVIGRNDIEVNIIARDQEELFEILNIRLPAIAGIIAVETAMVMKLHKYVQTWGRF